MNTTGLKYGGRQLGTPNKLTNELRNVLKDILLDELGTIKSKLDTLDTKDRLDVIIKLMPYAMPKIDSVEYHIGEGGQFDWS
jgi:chemotaxis regulatin CheY-phosphate phosphatase CheZ